MEARAASFGGLTAVMYFEDELINNTKEPLVEGKLYPHKKRLRNVKLIQETRNGQAVVIEVHYSVLLELEKLHEAETSKVVEMPFHSLPF